MSDLDERLAAAIAERDEVIASMDAERARDFVAKHGGRRYHLNWGTVLHLARWEIKTVPDHLRRESRLYLARDGKYGILQMNQRSNYAKAALDLLFPRDVTNEVEREALSQEVKEHDPTTDTTG